MEYYSHTNNKILIGHFPGNTKSENVELINELKARKFTIPDNIQFISVMTKDCIDTSPLNYQLTLNGYDYINPLKDRHMKWKRESKVKYIIKALENTTKKYSLILDGSDVVILSDLTDIVSLLESYKKKIIFNSTVWMYPHMVVDNVENRGQYGKYCFLNAGCAIGKTSDLLKFYKFVQDIIENSTTNISSEQYYVRKAFNQKQDEVFFDYNCKIFQCWHKAEYKIENDKTYLL